MSRETLTDEQVEAEIEKLHDSEYVKLAQYANRLRYRRRQYMYQLRWLEKRGKAMANNGVTWDSLNKLDVPDTELYPECDLLCSEN